ncbi:hypothetical protein [Streptomyces sp. AK02-01A]|uniref:hypothetical protein n=1 Tax=Streptomyces sp. AK02-01A TaxID=3028648 RepID=UPI0029AEC2D2|nr:hypothetical protein [Streptomyces sp. AK02-01A]MDX3849485.1 hypothetical protein [Streptomyces sp. AK02-01A]
MRKLANGVADDVVRQLRGTVDIDDPSADLGTRLGLDREGAADVLLCLRVQEKLQKELGFDFSLSASSGGSITRGHDDIGVGTGTSLGRLAPDHYWSRITGWHEFADDLEPGEMGLIAWRRQGLPGHVIAVYKYSAEGLLYIDPTRGPDQRAVAEPPVWDAVSARAVVFTPAGSPRAHGLPDAVESASTAHALLDPPVDHRYGVHRDLVLPANLEKVPESSSDEILWRFSPLTPEQIFRGGFLAPNKENKVLLRDYIVHNAVAQHISTTRDRDFWYNGRRYRYEIHPGKSVEPQARTDLVAKTFESEVSFTSHIEARAVVSVYDQQSGRTGVWNPSTSSVEWRLGDHQSGASESKSNTQLSSSAQASSSSVPSHRMQPHPSAAPSVRRNPVSFQPTIHYKGSPSSPTSSHGAHGRNISSYFFGAASTTQAFKPAGQQSSYYKQPLRAATSGTYAGPTMNSGRAFSSHAPTEAYRRNPADSQRKALHGGAPNPARPLPNPSAGALPPDTTATAGHLAAPSTSNPSQRQTARDATTDSNDQLRRRRFPQPSSEVLQAWSHQFTFADQNLWAMPDAADLRHEAAQIVARQHVAPPSESHGLPHDAKSYRKLHAHIIDVVASHLGRDRHKTDRTARAIALSKQMAAAFGSDHASSTPAAQAEPAEVEEKSGPSNSPSSTGHRLAPAQPRLPGGAIGDGTDRTTDDPWLNALARSRNWTTDFAITRYVEASGLVGRALGYRTAIGQDTPEAEYRQRLRDVVAAVTVARAEAATTAKGKETEHRPTPAYDAALIDRLKEIVTSLDEYNQAIDRALQDPETDHTPWISDMESMVEDASIKARALIPGLDPADVHHLFRHQALLQRPAGTPIYLPGEPHHERGHRLPAVQPGSDGAAARESDVADTSAAAGETPAPAPMHADSLSRAGSRSETAPVMETAESRASGTDKRADTVRRAVGPRRLQELDREDLVDIVEEVVNEHRRQHAGVAGGRRAAEGASMSPREPSIQECLDLLHLLRDALFPQGVATARAAADDSVLDLHPHESRLAAGDGWRSVQSWQTVADTLAATGSGSAAFVLVRRPRGIGHALAAFALPATATRDASSAIDVVWIDIDPLLVVRVGKQPPRIAPAEARAVVVGSDARIIPNALPEFHASTSMGHSVVDPSTHHQYAGLGGEFEVRRPVIFVGDPGYGTVVAVNDNGSVITTDHQDFYRAGDSLYIKREDAQQAGHAHIKREQHTVLEIVTQPAAALPGERRALTWDAIQASTESTFRRILTASERARLEDVFTRRDGWRVAEQFADGRLGPAPAGEAAGTAFSQFTIGVPVDGLLAALYLAEARIVNPNLLGVYPTARQFGSLLAKDFVERQHGPLGFGEINLLTADPRVRELWGYGWLFFNHISAGQHLALHARAEDILVKNGLPAACRHPLDAVRRALRPEVRKYLKDNSQTIIDYFEKSWKPLLKQAGVRSFPEGITSVLDLPPGLQDKGFTIRDALTYATTGRTDDGRSISQRDLTGMDDRDFKHLDSEHRPPLVLLELRAYAGTSGSNNLTPAELAPTINDLTATVSANVANRILEPQRRVDYVDNLLDSRSDLLPVGALFNVIPLLKKSSDETIANSVNGLDALELARSISDLVVNGNALSPEAVRTLNTLARLTEDALSGRSTFFPVPAGDVRTQLQLGVHVAESLTGQSGTQPAESNQRSRAVTHSAPQAPHTGGSRTSGNAAPAAEYPQPTQRELQPWQGHFTAAGQYLRSLTSDQQRLRELLSDARRIVGEHHVARPAASTGIPGADQYRALHDKLVQVVAYYLDHAGEDQAADASRIMAESFGTARITRPAHTRASASMRGGAVPAPVVLPELHVGPSASRPPTLASPPDVTVDDEFLNTWAASRDWTVDFAGGKYAEASGLVGQALNYRLVIGKEEPETRYRDHVHRIVAAVAVARAEAGTEGFDKTVIDRLKEIVTSLDAYNQAIDRALQDPETDHTPWISDMESMVEDASIKARTLIPGLDPADVHHLFRHQALLQRPAGTPVHLPGEPHPAPHADREFTANRIRQEHDLPPRQTYTGVVSSGLEDGHPPATPGTTGLTGTDRNADRAVPPGEADPQQVPATADTSVDTPQPNGLDADTDLFTWVNMVLAEERLKGASGAEVSLDISQVLELRDEAVAAYGKSLPSNTKGLAGALVDHFLGRGLVGLAGGGGGLEVEFTEVILLEGIEDPFDFYGKALIKGPGMEVVVEPKEFYRGPNNTIYRHQGDAIQAGGSGESMMTAVLEIVTDVMQVLKGGVEGRRRPPANTFRILKDIETRLRGLPGREGGRPQVPLAKLFPVAEGYEATELGRGALIGRRPLKDSTLHHVQYTVGVPMSGLYSFLKHVHKHTWLDESWGSRTQNPGYLTRTHLFEGLKFGKELAEDFSHRLSATEAAELKGYASLLYVNAAAFANRLFDDERLAKAHAAVLSRHAMADILHTLRPRIQGILRDNSDEIFKDFRWRVLGTLAQFYGDFRNIPQGEIDERARRFRIYLLSGLDHQYWRVSQKSAFGGMTELRRLDNNDGSSLPLVVLEVRAYGAEYISADTAQRNYERLADKANRLYAEAAAAEAGNGYPEAFYPPAIFANEVPHNFGIKLLESMQAPVTLWARELEKTARSTPHPELIIEYFTLQVRGFPKTRIDAWYEFQRASRWVQIATAEEDESARQQLELAAAALTIWGHNPENIAEKFQLWVQDYHNRISAVRSAALTELRKKGYPGYRIDSSVVRDILNGMSPDLHTQPVSVLGQTVAQRVLEWSRPQSSHAAHGLAQQMQHALRIDDGPSGWQAPQGWEKGIGRQVNERLARLYGPGYRADEQTVRYLLERLPGEIRNRSDKTIVKELVLRITASPLHARGRGGLFAGGAPDQTTTDNNEDSGSIEALLSDEILGDLPPALVSQAITAYQRIHPAEVRLGDDNESQQAQEQYRQDIREIAKAGLEATQEQTATLRNPGTGQDPISEAIEKKAVQVAAERESAIGMTGSALDLARHQALTEDSEFRNDLRAFVSSALSKESRAPHDLSSHGEILAAWKKLPYLDRLLPLSQLASRIAPIIASSRGTAATLARSPGEATAVSAPVTGDVSGDAEGQGTDTPHIQEPAGAGRGPDSDGAGMRESDVADTSMAASQTRAPTATGSADGVNLREPVLHSDREHEKWEAALQGLGTERSPAPEGVAEIADTAMSGNSFPELALRGHPVSLDVTPEGAADLSSSAQTAEKLTWPAPLNSAGAPSRQSSTGQSPAGRASGYAAARLRGGANVPAASPSSLADPSGAQPQAPIPVQQRDPAKPHAGDSDDQNDAFAEAVRQHPRLRDFDPAHVRLAMNILRAAGRRPSLSVDHGADSFWESVAETAGSLRENGVHAAEVHARTLPDPERPPGLSGGTREPVTGPDSALAAAAAGPSNADALAARSTTSIAHSAGPHATDPATAPTTPAPLIDGSAEGSGNRDSSGSGHDRSGNGHTPPSDGSGAYEGDRPSSETAASAVSAEPSVPDAQAVANAETGSAQPEQDTPSATTPDRGPEQADGPLSPTAGTPADPVGHGRPAEEANPADARADAPDTAGQVTEQQKWKAALTPSNAPQDPRPQTDGETQNPVAHTQDSGQGPSTPDAATEAPGTADGPSSVVRPSGSEGDSSGRGVPVAAHKTDEPLARSTVEHVGGDHRPGELAESVRNKPAAKPSPQLNDTTREVRDLHGKHSEPTDTRPRPLSAAEAPARGDTADGVVLSSDQLTERVNDVVARATLRHPAAGPSDNGDQAADLATRLGLSPDQAADLALCVSLLGDLKIKVYPPASLTGPGRTPAPGARSVDDSQLGIGGARSLLAPATAWTPVTDLDKIADTLASGETGLIVWHRRRGPGHAIAAYHTTEGIRWIDPQAPADHRVATTPPSPWEAVDAHAVVLNRDGHTRSGAIEWRSMGTAAARALTDPRSDGRYGAPNLKTLFGIGKGKQQDSSTTRSHSTHVPAHPAPVSPTVGVQQRHLHSHEMFDQHGRPVGRAYFPETRNPGWFQGFPPWTSTSTYTRVTQGLPETTPVPWSKGNYFLGMHSHEAQARVEDAQGNEYRVYGAELGAVVRHRPSFQKLIARKPGAGVVMIACNAGAYDDGLAQQVADYLETTVYAAAGRVYIEDYQSPPRAWISRAPSGAPGEFLPIQPRLGREIEVSFHQGGVELPADQQRVIDHLASRAVDAARQSGTDPKQKPVVTVIGYASGRRGDSDGIGTGQKRAETVTAQLRQSLARRLGTARLDTISIVTLSRGEDLPQSALNTGQDRSSLLRRTTITLHIPTLREEKESDEADDLDPIAYA